MKKETVDNIKAYLLRMIPDIARKTGVHNDEVEQVIQELYG